MHEHALAAERGRLRPRKGVAPALGRPEDVFSAADAHEHLALGSVLGGGDSGCAQPRCDEQREREDGRPRSTQEQAGYGDGTMHLADLPEL